MSIAPLMGALDALHDALAETGVLASGQKITVELPYPDGHRFEWWLGQNSTYLHVGPLGLRTIDDGPAPYREVDLGPVTVKWPLKLIALPNGAIVPEPVNRYVPGT